MSVLTLLESLSKEKSIPIIYLIGIIYLFSIDITIFFLLDFQSKDILYLLDIQKILLFNTVLITFFIVFSILIKKHFISITTMVFILTLFYAVYNNQEPDTYLKGVLIIFLIVSMLVFNIYKIWIEEHWLNNFKILTIANIIIGILITIIYVMFINSHISQWQNITLNEKKIELNREVTPHILIEPKSFNPVYLQELNQNIKLFTNLNLINKISNMIYKEDDINNKNFILIPHNDSKINNTFITTYYYDVNDIKNIFILNPNTCKKNKECKLEIFITKAINKNDISKGYQLISNYTHTVKLKG